MISRTCSECGWTDDGCDYHIHEFKKSESSSQTGSLGKQMKIAFISGHTDLSKYEFETHYQDKILEAIAQKHSFILGSAPGADRMALEFLIEQHTVPTVYLFEKNPENYRRAEELCKQHNINIKTEFTSYTSRDAQMTKDSIYDIAWVRPIDESKLRYGEKFDIKRISGTQRNIERRIKLQK